VATLDLFNTLSGTIQPLTPVGAPALRMYCCGPTVYDFGHIGNFRTFLHVDILRRFLHQQGVATQHVMNITDVDDKIIRNALAANLSIGDYSRVYEDAFFEDLDALAIERPEIIAHATDCIPDMVELIQQLAAKDIAYQIEDGSWYFRLARDPQYGKLSKKDLANLEDGARVDVDEYEKDAARDFALWKAVKTAPNGVEETSWDTALGKGRPGWHIECSAMATKFLGENFDLHAGGEDLMFPHHENEIAQSECASGQTFARHWMHVRFLLVEGKKMSKSEGNFYTLRDLLLRGYRASAIRFLLISVPYRHQLNFTFDGLTESTNAIDRLRTFHARMLKGAGAPTATPKPIGILSEAATPNQTVILSGGAAPNKVVILSGGAAEVEGPASLPKPPVLATAFPEGTDPAIEAATTEAAELYTAALANDLNTAEARAAIFDLVRAANTAADHGTLRRGNAVQILAVLDLFDQVFAVIADRDAELTRAALAWAEKEGRLNEADPALLATLALSDADIDALVADRTLAKKQRNFARADAIRNDLLAKGILLEDAKDGVRWKRK
jgi:cysteinyl-tRNA synthetase